MSGYALAVHELAHLATARARGVHARIGLGTRLQILVAQTTVSGLWGCPRSVRLRVYLAGVVSDLTIISAGYLVTALYAPHVDTVAAGYIAILGAGIFVGFFAAFLLATSRWSARRVTPWRRSSSGSAEAGSWSSASSRSSAWRPSSFSSIDAPPRSSAESRAPSGGSRSRRSWRSTARF